MCGRFAMDKETNDLIEEFVLDGNDFRDWSVSYSIAPTEAIPVVRERAHSDGQVTRTVEQAAWDFHPSFITNHTRPQFNARIETVATNGMWKGAFAAHRVIVPMRGYYEWTGEKNAKTPWFIHAGAEPGTDASAPLLAAAGLCTVRKVDGEWQLSAAIITREARDASGEVHDRMPAFVTPELRDEWLSPAKLTAGAETEALVDALLASSEQVAGTVRTHEVDRRVNNSRAVDPADRTLIDPA
ncbi:SOS response-associated peptidase [Schumannella luteola]|uniref:Abasic site processing protein n=1 Tax=Schumannella luteola TaxID=472059 RepID=A0A852YAY8_9MICO|nr:SOS response-associated peptidase [Schumannella luteola]NYG98361.1 putative SOS response-associated peptidase YedK [Schumannella luteola]TPX05782.1 SOS response-associated peptidase [Schumannella luteola]